MPPDRVFKFLSKESLSHPTGLSSTSNSSMLFTMLISADFYQIMGTLLEEELLPRSPNRCLEIVLQIPGTQPLLFKTINLTECWQTILEATRRFFFKVYAEKIATPNQQLDFRALLNEFVSKNSFPIKISFRHELKEKHSSSDECIQAADKALQIYSTLRKRSLSDIVPLYNDLKPILTKCRFYHTHPFADLC